MEITGTKLPGVKLFTPKRFNDHRGFFAETYNQRAYAGLGVDATFVQDNHSLSAAQGTVRGCIFRRRRMRRPSWCAAGGVPFLMLRSIFGGAAPPMAAGRAIP